MDLYSLMRAQQPIKVTVETHDGAVYELIGYAVDLEYTYPMDDMSLLGPRMTGRDAVPEFTMSVRGRAARYSRDEYDNKIQADSTTGLWECPYCGHVNPSHARVCGDEDHFARGCGGRRPLVYR